MLMFQNCLDIHVLPYDLLSCDVVAERRLKTEKNDTCTCFKWKI